MMKIGDDTTTITIITTVTIVVNWRSVVRPLHGPASVGGVNDN